MKTIKKSAMPVLVILLMISAFTGCDMLENLLESPDVILRIETFQIALNTPIRSASAIAENFAPAPTTTMADQMLTIDFWDAKFDPDNQFDFEITDSLDFDAVKAVMTESYTNPDTDETTTFDPVEVTFKMYKDGSGVWLIEEYYENGTNIIRQTDF